MATRPIKIVLASADRALLRHTSRLLTVFGYQVRTVASPAQAAALLRSDRPDILLVDGNEREAALELCRLVNRGALGGYTYKSLLVKDLKPGAIPEFLEAGVDDFFSLPLEHGELLARLRTAVRIVEFERRIARQVKVAAHLDGKEAFLAHAEVELRRAQAAQKPIACIVMQIDHHDIRRSTESGDQNEQTLLQAVRALNDMPDQLRCGAWLGENHFSAIVVGSASDATKLIEVARQARLSGAEAADEPQAGSDGPALSDAKSPTISYGVADNTCGAKTAHDLLRQAEAALLVSQASGGDFIACYGQFADEDRAWEQLAKTGSLFENSLARDIMVPCSVCLHEKHTLASAAAVFEHTRLQALPVVDDEGKLAGLLTSTGLQLRLAGDSRADQKISLLMTRDVASFDERTTLAAVIDYFTQESPLAIVIVNKGRPTGLVTPSSLATLSEQLTTSTFAPAEPKPGRAGLIVPNLCGVDA